MKHAETITTSSRATASFEFLEMHARTEPFDCARRPRGASSAPTARRRTSGSCSSSRNGPSGNQTHLTCCLPSRQAICCTSAPDLSRTFRVMSAGARRRLQGRAPRGRMEDRRFSGRSVRRRRRQGLVRRPAGPPVSRTGHARSGSLRDPGRTPPARPRAIMSRSPAKNIRRAVPTPVPNWPSTQSRSRTACPPRLPRRLRST